MSAISSNYDLYSDLGLTAAEEKQKSGDLGMEDFMNLLVTELTHQDPFKPMENSEMATQISQFATVSGIDDLNTSFNDFAGNMIAEQSIQAANLVGHEVMIESYMGVLPNGGSLSGAVYMPASGSNVKIQVNDKTGALVRELTLGQQDKGLVQFSWDGFTDTGEYADPGQYNITASATIEDADQGLSTMVFANVDSVSIGGNNGVLVNLEGLGLVSIDDVLEIH
ncbi:MAG: flagellar hook assembly protein FlgD [Candidatus Thiodiazotropha sp. (ex Myrtea spinifera)]|nr:flagellar hook assembly protein FlgD [Candidatus Thiodiazotropha sp. (ex Myrtea spinifera)]MCU7827776.1 flagellar hook assembly protein FlgD [Candidatus Thiodiazotropha sp. (ex Myrtea sp. 'scaly one' KF741663)]